MTENKIDLECGSTTANAERAKQVAFSPLMFVAGTKLMVPKASTISAPADLKGKTVVVTKGTTNEQAMHNVDKKFSLGLNIVTSPDHEQSYQMLVDGKADAFATDDILLYGLIARHKTQDKFKVTGEYLSYDPYGIMFRKGEPQLTAVVERTFRKLGSNRDLIPLYNKWFVGAAADRRKARRLDLAAARGGLQGARRYAGDEQLGALHLRKQWPITAAHDRRRADVHRRRLVLSVRGDVSCMRTPCPARRRRPHRPVRDATGSSASIITPGIDFEDFPARRRPGRHRSIRSACRSLCAPSARSRRRRRASRSPCSSRTGCAPGIEIVTPVQGARWPAAAPHRARPCLISPAARQHAGHLPAGDRGDRQFQHRTLAVADDRRPLLAENDDRRSSIRTTRTSSSISTIRRNRETFLRRKNLVRGEFKLRLGPDLEDGISAGAFVGLDDDAVRMSVQQVEHRGPMHPMRRDVFVRSSGSGTACAECRGCRTSASTSAVAALSLAIRCATALFSPRS